MPRSSASASYGGSHREAPLESLPDPGSRLRRRWVPRILSCVDSRTSWSLVRVWSAARWLPACKGRSRSRACRQILHVCTIFGHPRLIFSRPGSLPDRAGCGHGRPCIPRHLICSLSRPLRGCPLALDPWAWCSSASASIRDGPQPLAGHPLRYRTSGLPRTASGLPGPGGGWAVWKHGAPEVILLESLRGRGVVASWLGGRSSRGT